MDISISLHDSGASAALQRLIRAAENLRKPMREIGQMLITSTQSRFEGQHDPEGSAWAPLKPATIRARKGSDIKILQDSGALLRSITRSMRADSGSVSIRTNLPYARIHQCGGEINRQERASQVLWQMYKRGGFKKTSTGGRSFARRKKANVSQPVMIPEHVIRIPARPYLGINSADRQSALSILRSHLMGDAHD